MTSPALSKQQIKSYIQDYLFKTSSDPEFVSYLYQNKEKIKKYLEAHNLFEKRQHENLSEKEMMKINLQRYCHAFYLSKQQSQPDNIYRRADYIFQLIGITLNTAAFLNTIQLLANEEQAEKWRKLILSGQAFGGYGQTELGHGSNVQGLETEAHYDEKRKVFVIKSPKITSAKYWPGILGLVGTHSVFQARAFVKGKSIGIQTFVIQIRDQNLKNMKGVKAGDIGPKFGFHRVDNGYTLFDNVQIPLDWMLMKYVQVTPEGEVIGLQNKQAVKYAYGSMLYLRVALPFSFAFGHIIAPAVNLYKLYEKMGISNDPEYKKQIIEYLSVGQGIVVAGMYAKKLFNMFSNEIKAKNFEKADKFLVKCHITSATYKALTSWKALKISAAIATRNKYSIFRTTGIPYSFNNIVPSVTYEGDNSVLLQQTGRFILMKQKDTQVQKPSLIVKDNDLESIVKILEYVTSMEVRRLKKIFQSEFEGQVGMKTFWNQKHQRDVIDVSKIWGVLQLIKGFSDSLKQITVLQKYFTKVGYIFAKSLLNDTPQIHSYGFIVEETDSWKLFTDQEFWAMSHFQRTITGPPEDHKLIERKGQWLNSKL